MAQDLNINRIGTVPSRVDLSDTQAPKALPGQPSEFDNLLKDKIEAPLAKAGTALPSANPIKFSSHAMARIRDRGIAMGKEQMAKLEKAFDTAAAKGSKDSLILSNEAAFVVSVKNRTVITVVDRNAMSGNVFTNIDSTVLM